MTTNSLRGHFPCTYTGINRLDERGNFVAKCKHLVVNLLSIFLTPFYCIGLLLKWSMWCILRIFESTFRIFFGSRLVHDTRRVSSFSDKKEAIDTDQHKSSPKLIACPNCDHLHFSSSHCDCWECSDATPRLLECFKYHKKDAQLLMCPCVDCTYRRPASTTCEHCVMVSQMVLSQAKSPEDIEIVTRPKRRK